MMLLSCDVKVATRRPQIHPCYSGHGWQGSRQASLTAGFGSSCRPVGANEPLHDSTPARSGEGCVAEEVT